MEQVHATILLNYQSESRNIAVCESPDGSLWQTAIPQEFAPPGFALPLLELLPLSVLPEKEQQEIRQQIAEMSPELLAALREGVANGE